MKTLALVFGLLSLTGCGQKGPLYLPDNPSQITTEMPRQEQSQTEEEEDDTEEETHDE